MKLEELEIGKKKKNWDHPNYSIGEIGQKTEKSSGELKRIAATQTLEKKHQLTWVWKTCKQSNNDNYNNNENNGHFKRQTNEFSHEKFWKWLRKGNLVRETESLLIAAQNNAIRTDYIKASIDKMQQNSRCRLCGDRDETINLIVSECSKLVQKGYKIRHDWVWKMIH